MRTMVLLVGFVPLIFAGCGGGTKPTDALPGTTAETAAVTPPQPSKDELQPWRILLAIADGLKGLQEAQTRLKRGETREAKFILRHIVKQNRDKEAAQEADNLQQDPRIQAADIQDILEALAQESLTSAEKTYARTGEKSVWIYEQKLGKLAKLYPDTKAGRTATNYFESRAPRVVIRSVSAKQISPNLVEVTLDCEIELARWATTPRLSAEIRPRTGRPVDVSVAHEESKGPIVRRVLLTAADFPVDVVVSARTLSGDYQAPVSRPFTVETCEPYALPARPVVAANTRPAPRATRTQPETSASAATPTPLPNHQPPTSRPGASSPASRPEDTEPIVPVVGNDDRRNDARIEGLIDNPRFKPVSTFVVRYPGDVLYPLSSSQFALIKGRVVDLLSGEQLADLSGRLLSLEVHALSADGKLVAKRVRGREEAPVEIYATETLEKLCEVNGWQESAQLFGCAFIGSERLLLHWKNWDRDPALHAFQVWDAKTGERVAALGHKGVLSSTGPGLVPFVNFACSPTGDWLAVLAGSEVQIYKLSGPNSRPIVLKLPSGPGTLGMRANCVCFSPDGKELAANWGNAGNLSFAVGFAPVAANRPFSSLFSLSYPVGLDQRLYVALDTRNLEWDVSGNRFWAAHSILADRVTGRPLWIVFPSHQEDVRYRSRLVNATHVALPIREQGRYRLVTLPLPNDRIERSLAALNNRASDVRLRPNDAADIRLSITPYKLSAEVATAAFRETLTHALRNSGHEVRAGASKVIDVSYTERLGRKIETKVERSEAGVVILGGGQMLDYTLEISWLDPTSGSTLWSASSRGELSLFEQKGADPRLIEGTMSQKMISVLSQISIPYFIPGDSELDVLPLVSTKAQKWNECRA